VGLAKDTQAWEMAHQKTNAEVHDDLLLCALPDVKRGEEILTEHDRTRHKKIRIKIKPRQHIINHLTAAKAAAAVAAAAAAAASTDFNFKPRIMIVSSKLRYLNVAVIYSSRSTFDRRAVAR